MESSSRGPKNPSITFGVLKENGEFVQTRVMRTADIRQCPHTILVPAHYRSDGTCKCNDRNETTMRDWGYRWNSAEGMWK